jgi:hypothetical protein
MSLNVKHVTSCETCKYWNESEEYDDYKNIRLCNKAVQFFNAQEWVKIDGETKNVLKPEYKDQMMFTEDGSSYYSAFITRNDFFCAHWEKK